MFSTLVIAYLLCGGAGAACLLVASVLGLLSPRECFSGRMPAEYQKMLAPMHVVGMCALLLGLFFLMADLGRLDRMLLLLTSARATFMLAGVLGLILACALGALLTLRYVGCFPRLPVALVRGAQVVLAGSAAVVMVYTGLMLAQMQSVPLWNSPWLVVLFSASSASCGLALAVACLQCSGAGRWFEFVIDALTTIDCFVIVLEAVAVALLLVGVYDAGLTGQNGTMLAGCASVESLVTGVYAPVFWGVFAVCGVIAPLLTNALYRWGSQPRLYIVPVTVCCILVGAATLRWCVVCAGTLPVLV